MEIAALSGLVALGYAVSQLASPNKRKEGFHTLGLGILPQKLPPSDPAMPVPSEYYTMGIQQYLTKDEASKVNDINNRLNYLASTGSVEGRQSLKAQMHTILERRPVNHRRLEPMQNGRQQIPHFLQRNLI